jgi:tetratricopeptide (TPR) repeat protein
MGAVRASLLVWTALTLGSSGGALGCGEDGASPPPPAAAAASVAAAADAPKEKRTTSWQIEVRNLDSSIKGNEKVVANDPKRNDARRQLMGLLLQRASTLGTFGDLERAVKLGEEIVAREPRYPASYMARARALAAVHRFSDALADLDYADSHGALENQTRPQRGTVLMGLGRYDEACRLLAAEAAERRDFASKTLEGSCLSRQGRVAEADAKIAEAEASYRDVSSFMVAWMAFERASIWDREGENDKALPHYRRAVDHLPVYAHAVGHLALLLPPDQAEPLLRETFAVSEDPDLRATLAVVQEKRQPGSGAAMLAEAKSGYASLMERLPLAFADHAGWFYLGVVDDPERAAEVAELNLKNRPTPEAYELSIASLIAVHEEQEACDLAEQALALPYPSRKLRAMATKAFSACGKEGRAEELRASLGSK